MMNSYGSKARKYVVFMELPSVHSRFPLLGVQNYPHTSVFIVRYTTNAHVTNPTSLSLNLAGNSSLRKTAFAMPNVI